MNCANGHANNEDAAFCSTCGVALSEGSSATTPPPPPPLAATRSDARRSRSPLMMVGLAVLAVLVIGGGVFAFMTVSANNAKRAEEEAKAAEALVPAKAACSRLTSVDWGKQSLDDNKVFIPSVTGDLRKAASIYPAKWGELSSVASGLEAYVDAMEAGIALMAMGLVNEDNDQLQSGFAAQKVAGEDFDQVKSTLTRVCAQVGSLE